MAHEHLQKLPEGTTEGEVRICELMKQGRQHSPEQTYKVSWVRGRARSTGHAREIGFFERCSAGAPYLPQRSTLTSGSAQFLQSESLAHGEERTPEFTPCVLDHHLHTCPPSTCFASILNLLVSHVNLMSLNPQRQNVTGEGNLQGLSGLLSSSS